MKKSTFPYPRWHQLIFLTVGLAMLAFSAISAVRTMKYVIDGLEAEGIIVTLVHRPSSRKRYFFPEFDFTSRDCVSIRIVSETGWRGTRHRVGQKILVRYMPDNPSDAVLGDFRSLWESPILLALMGAAFSSIGAVRFFPMYRDTVRRKRLMAMSAKIEAKVHEIRMVSWAVGRPGVHPYRLTAKWTDSRSATEYTFSSSALWIDPTAARMVEKVSVYINPSNPKDYWIDTSEVA